MVIGAFDFVIAHAQPSAFVLEVSVITAARRITESGRELQIAAETNIARQQRHQDPLAYSILKGACKPRAKENCLSYVATKLPGMPETHDKEKSNGNGSLSVREIRLERLDCIKFHSRVLLIALIRQCCCGQWLIRA